MASHIFFFITLMMSITLATSLHCYACDKNTCKSGSYAKIDCSGSTGNAFADSLKSGIVTQCIKIEGIDDAGHPFQERNCTVDLGPSSCTLIANTVALSYRAKNVQCHICSSDYCNSGTTLFATFSLLISSVLFFF